MENSFIIILFNVMYLIINTRAFAMIQKLICGKQNSLVAFDFLSN